MTQRLNPLADRSSGSDSFGLTNYDNLEADVNYLIEAGADIASAATIHITNRFHKVTGTAQIGTITDDVGASAGQPLVLWIQDGLSLTVGGNILTVSGSNHIAAAGELVFLFYDGSNWRVARSASLLGVSYILNGTTTYTAPTGTRKLIIDGWGGGGAGAGAAASGGTSQCSAGSAGVGGAFAEKTLTTNIGTHTVAVGAGGAASTAGNADGGTGGDTTFANSVGSNVLTAKGGPAGTSQLAGGTSVAMTSAHTPATGNVGDFTITSPSGGRFIRLTGTVGFSDSGGNAPRGGSNPSTPILGVGGGSDGSAGNFPGGAGSGGVDTNNTARKGAGGGDGLLRVQAFS